MELFAHRRLTPAIGPVMVALGLLLSGCGGSPSSGGQPAATSSSPDPTGAAPHLAGNAGALEPGAYQFAFASDAGVDLPDALIEVPSGFEDGADWYVVSPDADAFLGLWTIEKVQRDACRRQKHDSVTPGPSVEDLVDALVAQKSSRATTPEPVTVGGYQGLYVELASPRHIRRCDKELGLWGDPVARGIYGDGQVDRLWVLDVDGKRLVVDASYGPTATAAEKDKLTSMSTSIRFVAAGEG